MESKNHATVIAMHEHETIDSEPTPEEGLRLIYAFMNIRSKSARQSVIELTERLVNPTAVLLQG